MKKGGPAAYLVILMVFLGVYIAAKIKLDQIYSERQYVLTASAPMIPPALLKMIAGEFKGLMSDYYLLKAASFIGSKEGGTKSDWNAVARSLEYSSVLDPYFKNTYVMTQGVLPWNAAKVEETQKILARSWEHLPTDWLPGFYLGFNCFYFTKDNLKASQYIIKAAKLPDAPYQLSTLGSRLASQAGQTGAALSLLRAMEANEKDEAVKRRLATRIKAIEGVQLLNKAIEEFKSIYGRVPDSLEELVDTYLIVSLPVNPYGHPYTYDQGKVDF